MTYAELATKADSEINLTRLYGVRGYWMGSEVRGPSRWEDDIDIVVDALHASGVSLEYTAPALLRGWERMESRRFTA